MAPPRRPIGRSGISVAPFALGGNVFGWTADEAASFRVLDRFVDAGFNLVDTADTYSTWVTGHHGGESETILGNWFRERGRRKDVIVATKVGMDMGPGGTGLAPERVSSSIEGSLRRLQTDYVDLYQAHVDDPHTPLEATLAAFDSLVEGGKVRAIGASNYGADRLTEALACSAKNGFTRFESLQPRYNLMDRADFEGKVNAVCRQQGLGVLTYSSLASGFLTGKYRSEADLGKSPRGDRAGPRLNARGKLILAALDEVSARVEAMTHEAMDGKIPIESVYGYRLDIIKPTAEDVAAVGRRYVATVEPTAKATIMKLETMGWTPIVISGGFRQTIRPLADFL